MSPCRPVAFLAVLVLAGGLAAAARATERADVPDTYKWRTEDLYPDEAAWLAARDGIAARLPELARHEGRLGESADALYRALAARMAVDSAFYRLRVYAMLRKDEDARLSRPSELSRMAEQLGVEYAAAVSWLQPELLGLGPDKVRGLVAADRRLEPYRPWIEDILRYAPHTGTAAEERIVSRAGIMTGTPSGTYDIFKAADMPYPEVTLSTGETVRLDDAAYTQYRALPEREDRRRVFRAFWGRHKDFERTLGTTLDAEIKTHLFDKDAHRFGSCLEAALFEANVPAAVYTQLIADVRANLPTLHRYLELRRRMMGLDTLGYEDLYAPIVRAVDLRYTPEEASELVLAAVAPLGEEYVATLRHGLDSGWTDWMPTTGKQSGAYSEAVYGVHPYQLLNFTGLHEEVSTLAHECGHSMHSWLSDRTQPYVTRDYKTFVAEVASTLNENLLLHHMLGRTKDRDTRLFLLGSRLNDMRQTLFRQVLFGEFELRINEMAERGEPLTGERLSALYLSLLREYYGHDLGVCRVDELYGVEWAYIQHFYLNFYMYQYATSIVGSTSIAAAMRDEAAPARDRTAQRRPLTTRRDAYLRLLSAGSTKDPITLLREAGVDMTTSAPFTAAMKEMNGIMDEMESLLGGPATPRR